VVQRRLTHVPYALYAAAGTPAPGDGASCALVTMDTAFETMPDVGWLTRQLPQARIAFRSNSREAQARACAAGAGFAVLPRPLGDAEPGLQRIDLGEAPPGRDVWVGFHRDLRRLARLRALLDAMVEGVAG
jgi:DNA-binding transcriptional LysR family regulator